MHARRRPQLHYQLELFTVLNAARHELLVPATVIAEVGYFLAREAGARVESLFPTVLADGDFAPVDLRSADYAQIADLVNTYESLPLGTTDASVVAIAERLGLTDVASWDRRQFTVVRPSTRMR
jgi:predicted nucleic acid-binding protein